MLQLPLKSHMLLCACAFASVIRWFILSMATLCMDYKVLFKTVFSFMIYFIENLFMYFECSFVDKLFNFQTRHLHNFQV